MTQGKPVAKLHTYGFKPGPQLFPTGLLFFEMGWAWHSNKCATLNGTMNIVG